MAKTFYEAPKGLQPVSVGIETAAQLLGVSVRTLWSYVRDGTLPAARLGRRILIPYAALQNFIEAHTDNSGALVAPDFSARRKATAKGGRQ